MVPYLKLVSVKKLYFRSMKVLFKTSTLTLGKSNQCKCVYNNIYIKLYNLQKIYKLKKTLG